MNINGDLKQPVQQPAYGGIYRRYIKRPIDFLGSLFAIIVLSPVLLVVAVLVRIKLGSPVIFKQKRPGLKGKIFTVYKFRTMTDKHDENGELLPDDIRLTKFGELLRSTSLDELPEFFNILKGDMSIVGPRPLLIEYLPRYNEKQKHRHDVLPGLTGWAQVNGRNAISWEDKFTYDLQYVEQVSFVIDYKIILLTIKKVFNRDDINASELISMEKFTGSRLDRSNHMILGIYGAGGLGREVLELAIQINQWKEIYFIDEDKEVDTKRGNIGVLTFDEMKSRYSVEDIEIAIAIGEPSIRELVCNKVIQAGYRLAILVHPSVYVSKTTILEEGVIIGSNTIVSCDVHIGLNTFIQNCVSIGHDTIIGKHSMISAFDAIAGACVIGDRTFIGMSVPVKEKIKIGSGTIVGMGSVVVRDIPDNVIAMGNPARPMKNKDDSRVFNSSKG